MNSATVDVFIQRPTRVSKVFDNLRAQILSGKMPANDLVPPETLLAKTFGVSRVVIREAMQTLRAQGLIEVSQGKRARVRPADASVAAGTIGTWLQRSDGTLSHLVEARRPLEGEIAFLAATRRTREHLEKAASSIDALQNASTLEDAVVADIHFHQILAHATGNPIFPMLLLAIGDLLIDSRRRTLEKHDYQYPASHHRKIFAAIEAGDGEAARQAMMDHLDLAKADLQEPAE